MRLSKEKNCIVGANGRNVNNDRGGGDGGRHPNDERFDLVGHCWFFKKRWLSFMWLQEPYTYDNGEDMHFCAMSNIYGNIQSWIPEQAGEISSAVNDYGADDKAHWRKKTHDDTRFNIGQHLSKMGWDVQPYRN